MLIPDFAWPVGRSIERDLDLNPALGAGDVDPLIRRKLRSTRECRGTRTEIQYTRRQAIDLELRIELYYAENAPGLAAKDKTSHRNCIAPDIQHATPAGIGSVAHVKRIIEIIGEECMDRSQCPDFSFAHQLARSLPLWMKSIHERFHHLQVWVLFGDIGQLLRFGSGQGDGLFAEHMFTSLQRLDRPGYVQVIWQRIVNCVNIGISQQFFVRTIRLRDAQLRCGCLSLFQIA